MKKLIKKGAKLAHTLIDILVEEIAGVKLSKEKKKSNGKEKNINRSRNSSGNTSDQHLRQEELEKYE
jgi:hypothetical protein